MADLLKVSRSNQKLGANIPSVNLQPCRSCRSDAPCAKLCYGKHGRFVFPNVQNTLTNNSDLWDQNPEAFEVQAVAAAFTSSFFRWHSTGDIVSPAYFEMMIRVAEKCKHTQFLCFTKQYEIVNAYMQSHQLPENLHIVFSAWGSWIPDNPNQLPMAYIRFKKEDNSLIPENAIECAGFCGQCVQTQHNCWNLHRGEAVVFNQH